MLMPATLHLSLSLAKQEYDADEYKKTLEEIFTPHHYELIDAEAYSFAGELFEALVIKRISYNEMDQLLERYTGPYANIFRMTGYLLLSGYTTATEACNLQLSIIGVMDSTMRQMEGVYRFSVIPYFETFWKLKAVTHASEFSGREHLQSNGFALMERSVWDKKVQTIFRVVTHHLPVNIPPSAIDLIDEAD